MNDDRWSQLSADERGHILEGLQEYIDGEYEEFETVEKLVIDLQAQELLQRIFPDKQEK